MSGHHTVVKAIRRFNIPEEMKKEELEVLEAVVWEDEDGDQMLMAYTRPGEGYAVAQAFDLAWCGEPTPAVQAMVERAVAARCSELIAQGFEVGLEYARTGKLPGVPEAEQEQR
jgi:hypothetical protein